MNDAEFYKSFAFNEFKLTGTNHRDNSSGIPLHYIGFMKKGMGIIISESNKIEVHEGDMFYIPKRCRYHSYWIGNDVVCFDSFGFEAMPKQTNINYTLQVLGYNDEVYNIYSKLSENKAVCTYSVGLLYMILGISESKMRRIFLDDRNELVNKAINYMRQNLGKKMPDVAAHCHVSEPTLYNVFKKSVKQTPNFVKQQLMCEKAITLLETTCVPIEEISSIAGFSSSSYFRKVLANHAGKQPSQIRKEAWRI